MTPALRTAILDARMMQWPEDEHPIWLKLDEPISRKYIASMLDMILPIAEPMIREAAVVAAAGRANQLYGHPAQEVEAGILALGRTQMISDERIERALLVNVLAKRPNSPLSEAVGKALEAEMKKYNII